MDMQALLDDPFWAAADPSTADLAEHGSKFRPDGTPDPNYVKYHPGSAEPGYPPDPMPEKHGLTDAFARVSADQAGTPSHNIAPGPSDVALKQMQHAAKYIGAPESGPPHNGIFTNVGGDENGAMFYDDAGLPVAAVLFDRKGTYIELVQVRGDARGHGWGAQLYDFVQDHTPVNMYDAIGTSNAFTYAGKQFALAWLRERAKFEGVALAESMAGGKPGLIDCYERVRNAQVRPDGHEIDPETEEPPTPLREHGDKTAPDYAASFHPGYAVHWLAKAKSIPTDPRYSSNIDESRKAGAAALDQYFKDPAGSTIGQYTAGDYSCIIVKGVPMGNGLPAEDRMLYVRQGWEPVLAGKWMGWPEESWGLSNGQWGAMSEIQRATREAQEQVEKYAASEYDEMWLTTYRPDLWDARWFGRWGSLSYKGGWAAIHPEVSALVLSTRTSMLAAVPLAEHGDKSDPDYVTLYHPGTLIRGDQPWKRDPTMHPPPGTSKAEYARLDQMLADAGGPKRDLSEQRVDAGPDGQPVVMDMAHKGLGWDQPDPATARPPQYLWRAVTEQSYQRALKQGSYQSQGRLNLASDEGTVASVDSGTSFYLPGRLASNAPGDYVGRIMRIRYDAADGWRFDPRDSYIKTQKPIPMSRIDWVTPPIVTRRYADGGIEDIFFAD